MTIPKNARLHEVLQNIPVDPMLARIDAIYLKRASVAMGQKKSIQDSIKRLQETLLLARPSGNTAEVAISEGELQLLEKKLYVVCCLGYNSSFFYGTRMKRMLCNAN